MTGRKIFQPIREGWRRSDVAFLDGVVDEVGSHFNIQFFHDIGTVMFYGACTDKEKIADLLPDFPSAIRFRISLSRMVSLSYKKEVS